MVETFPNSMKNKPTDPKNKTDYKHKKDEENNRAS